MQQGHDFAGVGGHLVGAKVAGFAGQIGFGGFAGARVDRGGQMGHEAADHLDVPVADQAVALGGGGRGQRRRQRFPGERAPLAEVVGFGDAPVRFGFGDPQPVSQRPTQLAA